MDNRTSPPPIQARPRDVLPADGFFVEELCQAVDGCLASPHHQGQNANGQKYDDLELICRSPEHVERFIRIARCPRWYAPGDGPGRIRIE